MKAVAHATELPTPAEPIRIEECVTCDLITASKAQLRMLGFDVDVPYPGEPDGPKRRLNLTDPRGLPAKIEFIPGWQREGAPTKYFVVVSFPGAPGMMDYRPGWVNLNNGLQRREQYLCDEYRGTGEALVAAGLMRGEDAPGPDGWRKRTVYVAPDGKVYEGGKFSRPGPEFRAAGAKVITKLGGQLYNVEVKLDEEFAKARSWQWDAAYHRALDEFARSRPRPPSLGPICLLKMNWSELKLVWAFE